MNNSTSQLRQPQVKSMISTGLKHSFTGSKISGFYDFLLRLWSDKISTQCRTLAALCFVVFSACLGSGSASAQCVTATNGQFPAATFTPTCSGSFQNISTSCWNGEYSVVQLTAGTAYSFSSSITTDYVTISTNATTPAPLAFGTTPVSYTPTTTTTYRFYTHNSSACGSNTTSKARRVTCAAVPPACNTLTSPANGATGVSSQPTVLTYSAATGATSYDIYFGTAPNPPLLGNTTATSVNITYTISGTTYYWYAVPRNAAGAAAGCISNQRSFTTATGPANDVCAGAATLAMNAAAVTGTTVNADMTLAPIACAGFTAAQAYDVWYKFTAIATTQTVTVVGVSSFDPVVQGYSGTCGTLVSLGCADATTTGGTETLTLTGLTICNTYYIRLYNYEVAAGTFTIRVAGTSTLSAPTSASATPNPVCNDGTPGNISLTATGGAGGIITWYSGSCGSAPIGTGSPLVIAKPLSTTTYFVRRTTACGNDLTACVSTTVTVNQPSTDPTSATATATTICTGDATSLTLNGGGGGTGEVIRWYSGSCGGTLEGSGNNLSVSPATTTTYYGRYETGAPCNLNSACASVTITVNPNFTINASAGANGSVSPGGVTTLSCFGTGSQTYTITPDACYSIADVEVDGNSIGAVGTYTFTNVQADHTISATFVLSTYTITATAGANGTITPGTGSVNCGDDVTYTITPDACYTVASVVVDGVSQGAVSSFTFTNVTADHTISVTFALINYTITVSATGGGSVNPATGTVGCGSDATYSITPFGCYSIVDVLVDGQSVGAVPTYTFTNVQVNHTISASFALNGPYTITATSGANGTVTPAGNNSVPCGTDNEFTITPDACYSIEDVLVDGQSVGAVSTYLFSDVQANHTISATFTLNTFTLTATSGANGTVTPTGTTTVNCADNFTYTITADACYSIADVVVDGQSVGAMGTYTFTNVQTSHTISATFVQTTYSITATTGGNGSITPSGATSVNCGADATYTITADACYSIADVLVDGGSVGAVGTYTFTNVTTAHTISATFVINTFTITATSGANGTVTPAGASTVACGANVTYTITPATCYGVADVLVDGQSVGAVTSYTFTNVQTSHTISATSVATAPAATPVVTGITNVCPYIGTGQQITYTATSAGATSFQWTIPANTTAVGPTNGSSITLTFQTGFASQANKQLRVRGLSACGNSAQVIFYLVAQYPPTPQPITGPMNVCPILGTNNTYTYTIPPVTEATGYSWTAQAGTTIVTNNGTSATVQFLSGFTTSTITVAATNGCGTSGIRNLTVQRVNPGTPGPITGPTNSCPYIAPGGTPATYSIGDVPNAVSYTWTVPQGSIGLTGQGTTSISFTYPAGYTGGSISVTATNGCGTSNPRALSITKLNPAYPSQIDVIQTADCPGRVYTYSVAGFPSNTTSIQWTVPAGGTITGGQGTTSITVTYVSTAVSGNVTAQAINNCGASSIRALRIQLPACPPGSPLMFSKAGATTVTPVAEGLSVQVSPNPTTTDFQLKVTASGTERITVRILDMQGRSYKTFTATAHQSTRIGADLKAGAYILEVRQGNVVRTEKLLKF